MSLKREAFKKAAMDHLKDPNTYRRIPRMSAKTIENKVNSTWTKICHKNQFPRYIQRSFIASNTDLPRFYHLIKTHKPGPDIRIRPIVSNINGPTQRISWLLARALKSLLNDVPAHLKNSLDLIDFIRSGDQAKNRTFTYPFSLDVVSLYTSIPIPEAIICALGKIK